MGKEKGMAVSRDDVGTAVGADLPLGVVLGVVFPVLICEMYPESFASRAWRPFAESKLITGPWSVELGDKHRLAILVMQGSSRSTLLLLQLSFQGIKANRIRDFFVFKTQITPPKGFFIHLLMQESAPRARSGSRNDIC